MYKFWYLSSFITAAAKAPGHLSERATATALPAPRREKSCVPHSASLPGVSAGVSFSGSGP